MVGVVSTYVSLVSYRTRVKQLLFDAEVFFEVGFVVQMYCLDIVNVLPDIEEVGDKVNLISTGIGVNEYALLERIESKFAHF